MYKDQITQLSLHATTAALQSMKGGEQIGGVEAVGRSYTICCTLAFLRAQAASRQLTSASLMVLLIAKLSAKCCQYVHEWQVIELPCRSSGSGCKTVEGRQMCLPKPGQGIACPSGAWQSGMVPFQYAIQIRLPAPEWHLDTAAQQM